MAWAKLHTDILADPKLMRAARRGARGLNLLPWLIVIAKQCEDEGRFTVAGEPMEPADMAPLIPGVTETEVAEACRSLIEIGVLVEEAGALRLAAWGRRQQRPSETPAAVGERVRKHRRKVKRASNDTCNDGCNDERNDGCNATEERERRGEEETTRARGADPGAPNWGAWVDPFAVEWEAYVGIPSKPKLVLGLQTLIAAHGLPQVFVAWRGYLRDLDQTGKLRYASERSFAERYLVHAGQWAALVDPEYQTRPIPDEPGRLDWLADHPYTPPERPQHKERSA
jgi:hypothetical protein